MIPARTWPAAVVFDLDGTLVDSAPDIAAALNVALEQEGHAALPVALVTSFVGGGARLLIERALGACGETAHAARIDAVYVNFQAAYAREPARRTKVHDGARDVLDHLRGDGVHLGICTNKPAALAAAVLEGLNLTYYFSSIVAADGNLPLKPAPDMLRKCLSDLNVAAGQAVMVGDSEADAGAAQAAGVSCILMTHGYSQVPLANLGARAVIGGFERLLTQFDQATMDTV